MFCLVIKFLFHSMTCKWKKLVFYLVLLTANTQIGSLLNTYYINASEFQHLNSVFFIKTFFFLVYLYYIFIKIKRSIWRCREVTSYPHTYSFHWSIASGKQRIKHSVSALHKKEMIIRNNYAFLPKISEGILWGQLHNLNIAIDVIKLRRCY